MTIAMPQPPLRLAAVAAPLFLELALGIAVGIAGTALAAGLGDTSAAAFALANHVLSMLFILFRIVGAGVSVVVAQALGRSQRAAANELARAALGASTWLGGAIALVAWLAAAPLMAALNAPADVAPLAVPLLQAMAPALLLDALNATQSSVMRAHLRGGDVLRVIVAMHAVHLLLAFALMRGAGPLQSLGLPGFAIALLVSRSLGTVLHRWLWRERLGLTTLVSDWWRLRRKELGTVLAIGAPGAAENILYRLAFTVSVAVAGQLGGGALAAHAYASQITYVVLLAGLATGLAVEIVLGHHIGAGRLHDGDRLVRRALAIGLPVSVLVATTAALAGPTTLRLFTSDATIVARAAILLWWTVLLEPGRTFNLVLVNALRAAGDARFPVMAGAASMIVVLAGGSWWLGVHLGLGLVGLWIAYAADEWLRGLLMWWRWRSRAWVPHARAAHRRLHDIEAPASRPRSGPTPAWQEGASSAPGT
ncbi:MAG: MATE family efflux transporter [Aquincola sp.]|nr:MATE family efflux transporter [Aquincola sp.]